MKKIKNLLPLAFVVAFMFFFASPVSAQIKINCLAGHVDNLELARAATGTDVEDNYKVAAKFFYSAGCVFLEQLAPQATTTNASNLPGHMQKGILGMLEDQVVVALSGQPKLDVANHLAREWIPGYEGSSSLYAGGYDDIMSTGVDTLWSLSRNIAYLGFVVIMIVVGFMIMFRNKIQGQMVVSIGNSIPRIIISLLLVTFSFAIAGIILDICGVFMSIIVNQFEIGIPIDDLEGLLGGTLGSDATSVLGLFNIVGDVVGVLTGSSGSVNGSIAIVLVTLVVVGIIVWGAIKMWITLLKAYATILVNVIISPIAIMIGATPGNSTTTVNIFKAIFRSALVFPIAFAIVSLPYLIESRAPGLTFPDTLTTGQGSAGTIILAFAKILALFVAAKAPVLALAIVPPSSRRNDTNLNTAVRAGLGKIPVLGKMMGA
jgi:hypothetical protein